MCVGEYGAHIVQRLYMGGQRQVGIMDRGGGGLGLFVRLHNSYRCAHASWEEENPVLQYAAALCLPHLLAQEARRHQHPQQTHRVAGALQT